MRDAVVYFAGCFAKYYAPETGTALVELLAANGIEVFVPEQKCCGMPMMANGNFRGARKRFLFNAGSLRQALPPAGGRILTTCPSCNLMLRREGPSLFPGEDAAFVSGRVRDAGEYLHGLHRTGRLRTPFGALSGRVFYHNPCHLKVQGITAQPVELLKLVPGLELAGVNEYCCGMGGSYGMKSQNYERSAAIGRKLWGEVEAARPDVITTECGGCALQIEAGTGRKCTHPVVLLRRAHDAARGPSSPPKEG